MKLIKFIVPLSFFPSICYGRFTDGDMIQGIGSTLLIWAFLSLIAFLILREVFCWYLKINQRIGAQNEIRDLLSRIARSNDELISLMRGASPAFAVALAESDNSLQDQLEIRKKTISNLKDRHVCPRCYRDYSKYVLSCEDCGIDLVQSAELS